MWTFKQVKEHVTECIKICEKENKKNPFSAAYQIATNNLVYARNYKRWMTIDEYEDTCKSDKAVTEVRIYRLNGIIYKIVPTGEPLRLSFPVDNSSVHEEGGVRIYSYYPQLTGNWGYVSTAETIDDALKTLMLFARAKKYKLMWLEQFRIDEEDIPRLL